nr:MAG TPA: hypothetical protein [Caudoviricetes sp.]
MGGLRRGRGGALLGLDPGRAPEPGPPVRPAQARHRSALVPARRPDGRH